MSTNLQEYFSKQKLANPNTNIAGFVLTKNNSKSGSTSTFHWCRRPSASNLPAAAYIVDYLKSDGKKTKIYTDLEAGHWIRTYYTNIKTFNQETAKNVVVDEFDDLDVSAGKKLSLKLISGDIPWAPPIPGGGLYQAALNGLKMNRDEIDKLSGEAKVLNRVLRYYMLAAYSLLGLCKREGYNGGNYVAALIVSDSGQIISYGINNGITAGSFHHAEVNMLLNYFQRNPTNNKFPSRSIVFSTLTPCQQCTKYLINAKPDESLIFFGQMDTGEKGKKGAKISNPMDIITKPIRGTELNQGRLNYVQITSGLQNCMTDDSIAGQISDTKPSAYLTMALEHFEHKLAKGRDYSIEEQSVKRRVINYLFSWLEFC